MVANFLCQNGIAPERVETISRGETNPAVAGSGEEAWAKNRRGEFIIMKK
jgi:peptidoglycan-associated lipoprotein